jgi:hypothetical protein
MLRQAGSSPAALSARAGVRLPSIPDGGVYRPATNRDTMSYTWASVFDGVTGTLAAMRRGSFTSAAARVVRIITSLSMARRCSGFFGDFGFPGVT